MIQKNAAWREKNHGWVFPFVGFVDPSVAGCDVHKQPFVCRNNPFSRISGFSLIELVVTLVIASIIVAWGVPNFRTFIQNNSMTGQVNELVGDINYGRSEAIKRVIPIGMCISSDGATCTGADWALGRILWVDQNANNVFDAGETVLRSREATGGSAGTTIRVGSGTPPTAPSSMTANGLNPLIITARGAASISGIAQFRFCDSRGVDHARTVTVSATGQVQTLKGTPILGNAIACP